MKKYIVMVLSALFVLSLSACKSTAGGSSGGESGDGIAYRTEVKDDYLQSLYLTDYVEDLSGTEREAFERQGLDRQSAQYLGIAVSSYYSVKVDGEDVYTYMIAVAETKPHSVVFLDVSEDKFADGKELTVEVTVKDGVTVTKAIVLPEKLGVTAVVEGEDKVSFTVGDYGNYTMVVNDYTDPDKAFTIFVRRPEYVEVPEGYTLIEYKPGLHFVDNIFLQGNTVLYLHAGAFLVAKKPAGPTGEISNAFIYANAADNLKIVGHGVIDFSQLPWHARRGVYIGNSNGVEMNGVTLINASSWASTFMYCKNLTVRDCIIFGYRTNSDAYAVCSCEDGEIVDCFARSGDDLFEVKTYSAPLKNILFENCTAFPDNCRGFGLTQESNSLLTDITYRNCSLLYQLNDWASHMSAFNIDAGEQGSISGLTFEKCDLFYSKVYAVHISVGENEWTMGVKGYNNSATNITFRECSFKYPVSGRGFMKVRNNTSEVNAIDNVFFDRCTIGENGTPIASLSTFPDGAVDYEGLTTPSSAFRFA